ncbi:MAG: hypothetical protein CVV33_01070 [Methanomicrobiales archaeon HGW-Methanomicrobiales-4]|nr:MAG: hypothetical protein CVV33_01070 [Methanomicrobiales archaeon HGW-Methanomicrobiales-4]
MKFHLFPVVIILICLLFLAGCISNSPDSSKTSIPEKGGDLHVQNSLSQTEMPVQTLTGQTTSLPSTQVIQNQLPEANGPSLVERRSDMAGFISTSFPEVTNLYTDIKKSRNALEWKQVQEKALQLQLLIQDLTKTYQLNTPNPEKNVFKGLDSREQIVLLKYIQYLDDMESYATNLKNAVYYQERGSDPQSAQTALRYQGQADQFEKKVITEIKTISDYFNDFKYSFLNQESVRQYRFVG